MAAEQVRIQLTTPHADLKVPNLSSAILVSTNVKRYELSTLVNTLLHDSGTSSTRIPLQFTINSKFLRGSLSDALHEHGLSGETTLDVEYVRAQAPPTTQTTLIHDDWVGSVDVLSNNSGKERILSGCYDGLLRVWNLSGDIIAASAPCAPVSDPDIQSQLIYASKFISPSTIVSGGFGVPVRLWSYEETQNSSPTPRGTITPLLDFHGHSEPLTAFDSISVDAATERILTSSADCTAMLWSASPSQPTTTSPPSTSTSNRAKKQRRDTQQQQPAQVPAAAPLATLSGHVKQVFAAIFHPHQPADAAYTASQDRTVRTWDLVTGACVASRTPSPHAPLQALAALPRHALLAAAAADRRIFLVDPRADARRTAVAVLRACDAEPVCLAAEPEPAPAAAVAVNGTAARASNGEAAADGAAPSPASTGAGHGLASAGFDGVVRVWDVRSPATPTYSVRAADSDGDGSGSGSGSGRAQKLFSLVWDRRVGLVAGGEDGRARVCSSPHTL